MDRFRVTDATLKSAIKFIKTGKGKAPMWATRYKEDLSVKGSKLFYKTREVVSKERVSEVLRDELYKKDGDCPSERLRISYFKTTLCRNQPSRSDGVHPWPEGTR